MLYVVPAPSAFHFDSHPHYRYQEPHLPFESSYLGHNDSFYNHIPQRALAGQDFWTYEQPFARRSHIQEPSRRALYQSLYAAEQRELARRVQEQQEVELARTIAIIAARRRQAEEAARRERAVAEYRRQRELNEFQQAMLALLGTESEGSHQPSVQLLPIRQAAGPRRAPAIRRPNRHNYVVNNLNARLQGEADPQVVDTLRSILNGLSSDPTPSASAAPAQPLQDKGKGKAPAENVVEAKPESSISEFEAAIQDYIRSFFQPVPHTGEAGPSGTAKADAPAEKKKHASFKQDLEETSSTPQAPAPTSEPTVVVSEAEVAQRSRTQALSSIQQIKTQLNTLESEFQLPASLDHHSPSILENDDVASVSSTASDLSRLIPYTTNNASVLAYENALGNLLELLDGVESGGDLEVREARKEVVREVERALGAVASAVEDEIAKAADVKKDGVAAQQNQPEETVERSIENADSGVDYELLCKSPEFDNIPVPFSDAESSSIGYEVEQIPSSSENVPHEATPEASDTDAPIEGLHPDLQSVSVDPTESPSPTTQSPSSEQVVEITERSEPEVKVENIDTFLLPASSPVTPEAREKIEDYNADDDAEVIVVESEDLERNEWSEVEA